METITIQDETIGYYIPTQSLPHKKDVESLRQAVTELSAMLAEKGLSEDDIVADFQELRHKSHSISINS